jgi:phage terminase large subunit
MYSPMRRKQMIEGDWSALTGQYFTLFNHPRRFQKIRWSDLRGCRFERWIDWGSSKPGVCYWVAIFPSGHVHTFYEYKWVDTLASTVATTIRDVTRDLMRRIHGEGQWRISKSVADPSMFKKEGSVAEDYALTFARYGVKLVEGNHERVLGWGRMREWMAMDATGRMWWTVDPEHCPYACRSIPSLVRDKHDEEDVNSEGDDHPADAHRYGFMARPSPDTIVVVRTPPLTDSVRALLNGAQAAQSGRPAGMIG